MQNTNTVKDKEYHLNRKEIIIIVAVCVIIFCTPFFLSLPNIGIDLSSTGIANIGTALSITAPFISIGAGILVYMAFKVQNQANLRIATQFEQQNSDQTFFKLIDTLNGKIEVSQINDGVAVVGLTSFHHVIEQFKNRIEEDRFIIGCDIVINHKEIIDLKFHNSEFTTLGYSGIETTDFNDLEVIARGKSITNHNKSFQAYQLISAIGTEYFYLSTPQARLKLYHDVFENLYSSYGSIIENYITTLKFLLHFIYEGKHHNREFYLHYLTENTTGIERALIFYYCASERATKKFKEHIIQTEMLYAVDLYITHFFKNQNEEAIKKEISLVLENK